MISFLKNIVTSKIYMKNSFLEFSKLDINSKTNSSRQALGYSFYNILLMLHPFIPKLSQYIYSNLSSDSVYLGNQSYPTQLPFYKIDTNFEVRK